MNIYIFRHLRWSIAWCNSPEPFDVGGNPTFHVGGNPTCHVGGNHSYDGGGNDNNDYQVRHVETKSGAIWITLHLHANARKPKKKQRNTQSLHAYTKNIKHVHPITPSLHSYNKKNVLVMCQGYYFCFFFLVDHTFKHEASSFRGSHGFMFI